MKYQKAKTLKHGDVVTLKRNSLKFTVSYPEEVINPDNDQKHCWVHVTEKDELGCDVFHHREII